MSKKSFADLGVSKTVCSALAALDITTPFAIQDLAIEDVMDGYDVLAKSPTGSGKTLVFALPMVERLESNGPHPTGLVLAPTRELATQIVDHMKPLARARNLKVASVYGGVGYDDQIRDAKRAQMIVATPGRLEDLLERRAITLKHIRILVLDEADRMLDMGFRPAVDQIVARCPRDRQTLFFSATLDGAAGWIAQAYTNNPRKHSYTPEPDHIEQKVEHRFIGVDHHDRTDTLVEQLRGDRELALVFVRTKRGADRLVRRLKREGVRADAMHGDKSQAHRERALANFSAGRVDTLIATDVAARGIDVDDISHVINYDPPEDRDGYIHRVGRTGRAGRGGIGITLVPDEHVRIVEQIAIDLDLTEEFKQSGLRMTPTRPGQRLKRRQPAKKRTRTYRAKSRRWR